MVAHPDINPVQQGLTSVNRREPVFPFGASRTSPTSSFRKVSFHASSNITAGHGHSGHPLPWNDWASFLVNAGQRSHRSGF